MSATVERRSSGRFVLRIDPGLHGALREAARAAGVSLNEYCARKLATPTCGFEGLEFTIEAVQRAATIVGENFVGLAAFGSWTREELHDQSDIDLLVVVEDKVRLSRELYLAWDEAPIWWNGHRVEPHFVHLPDLEGITLGLWAEAAVDAIILFTRDLTLPSRLARVRNDIAAGRIVRRVVHGQPYWTEVD